MEVNQKRELERNQINIEKAPKGAFYLDFIFRVLIILRLIAYFKS